MGLVPKSPIHIGLISAKNPKPNISHLGPFKCLRISSYIRKPFLKYEYATDPIWISLYEEKFVFFLLVYGSSEPSLKSQSTFLQYFFLIFLCQICLFSSCFSSFFCRFSYIILSFVFYSQSKNLFYCQCHSCFPLYSPVFLSFSSFVLFSLAFISFSTIFLALIYFSCSCITEFL